MFVFKFWRAWLNFVKICVHSHFEIGLSAVVNYQFRKCTISSFSDNAQNMFYTFDLHNNREWKIFLSKQSLFM